MLNAVEGHEIGCSKTINSMTVEGDGSWSHKLGELATVQEKVLNPYDINWYRIKIYEDDHGNYLGWEMDNDYYDSEIIYFAIER